MKRVAFFMQTNQSGWLGGLSYLRNLLTAVCSNIDRRIEPVLLVHPALEQTSLGGFPHVEVVRSPLVAPRHPARLASRLLSGPLKRDLTLEWLLRGHRIDALSHSTATGSGSTVASIGWIPDFQHVRMPQYFTQKEREGRDRQFMRLINGSRCIVLSSHDAQRDFTAFAPHAVHKTRVLQFVSCPGPVSSALPREELRARFGVDRPYFHLPNQFWTHKNHAVVVEALGILKRRSVNVLVLATGSTGDHRDPQHFERLMARAKQLGVEDHFRALGIVALPELQSLMLNAIALVNPSNFEGWSTSVEESKSLGLSIILSDIPVHIEQAPPLGRYFKTGSAEDLADALAAAVREHDPDLAGRSRAVAAEQLPARINQFGKTYEEIAIGAVMDAGR